MQPLPSLSFGFSLATALALGLFVRAAPRAGGTLLVLAGWLLVQAAVALTGFYTVTSSWPPRPTLLLGPPLLGLTALLATAAGRRYLDGLQLRWLTLLHTVRVAVELVLYALYLHHAVPRLLTFAGSNWDILAGLSAPVVYYLAFCRRVLGRPALLLWNFLALGLLLNVVLRAVLAIPSPLQRLAFEQPNVAVLYFPYCWLPAVVVPLVLTAHVAALRQLLGAWQARSSAS